MNPVVRTEVIVAVTLRKIRIVLVEIARAVFARFAPALGTRNAARAARVTADLAGITT